MINKTSLAAPPLRREEVSKSCTTTQGFVRANQIAKARDVAIYHEYS